jgi:hypothetical protein
MGTLDVKVPPDILNDESPDAGIAPENGSVRLRCKATGIPEPTVTWRREDSRNIILRHDGEREKQCETHIRTDVFHTNKLKLGYFMSTLRLVKKQAVFDKGKQYK